MAVWKFRLKMKLNENLMELGFRAKGFSHGHQLIEEKGEGASRQQLAGCKLPQDQHYQTKVLSRRRTAFEYGGMYYYCGIGSGTWSMEGVRTDHVVQEGRIYSV